MLKWHCFGPSSSLLPIDPELSSFAGMYFTAIEADPTNCDALTLLATLCMSGGHNDPSQLTHAEDLFQRALAVNGNHAGALGQYASLIHDRAMSTSKIEDVDLAEELYMQAVMANPSKVSVLSSFGGFQANMRRDPIRAELLYRTALEYDITHSDTLWQYGNLLRTMKGRDAAAEDMYRCVPTLCPCRNCSCCYSVMFL